jgi:hypothetical protein
MASAIRIMSWPPKLKLRPMTNHPLARCQVQSKTGESGQSAQLAGYPKDARQDRSFDA